MMIAFSGISGCGKSTLTEALSKELQASAYIEPEEAELSEVNKNPTEYGAFSSWMGYRQVWLLSWMKADADRNKQKVALVDNIFLKTLHGQLESGEIDLIPPQDPYKNVLKEVSKLDKELLPHPDMVVYVEVSYETWIAFLSKRGRPFDSNENFHKLYEAAQKMIYEATKSYCTTYNIPLKVFQQNQSDLQATVDELKKTICPLNER